MEITKHLLFNLSLLLVLLYFIQIWFERKMTIKKPFTIFYVYGMVAILLCMLFSIYINQEVRLDLRLVPLIIAGLYLSAGFLFAFMAIIIRAIIGIDSGFWVTCILNLSTASLLFMAKPYFNKLSSKNRISVCVVINMISSMIFVGVVSFFGFYSYGINVWIPYFIIAALGTGIISYAIESMNTNMKMRDQLLKTKRIEAVSQMGAAISHEIRNPLTSARGFLQFLNEGENLNLNQKEYIGIAITELDQAEEVIGNYLTFAKPAMERVEELNIHWIFLQVMSEITLMVGHNDVKIERDFTSSGTILGDKRMLHRCFYNLIKNCIQSMPEGGKLTLHTSDTKDATIITITDTGGGMTEEQVNRLGEPFYSIHEGNGTGLGMMVVHSILRAMNGSIEIKSKLNKGTQFILTFPKTERTRQII
jgi:two-component system, sporulation sensor kinase B